MTEDEAKAALAEAIAALAPFERAYTDLKYVTVKDLEVAARLYWKLTMKPGAPA